VAEEVPVVLRTRADLAFLWNCTQTKHLDLLVLIHPYEESDHGRTSTATSPMKSPRCSMEYAWFYYNVLVCTVKLLIGL
jgi:hypothetical protein